jgi:hypothetical protein
MDALEGIVREACDRVVGLEYVPLPAVPLPHLVLVNSSTVVCAGP